MFAAFERLDMASKFVVECRQLSRPGMVVLLERRRASRTTSLAELYRPDPTFALTNCSSSGVSETVMGHSPFAQLRVIANIVNVRYSTVIAVMK